MIPLLGAGLGFGASLVLPEAFPFLLFFSVWGTSFPHTFGSFTRRDLLNFRGISMAVFIYGLVLIPILILKNDLDLRWLFTLYFFWQQYHYARQNYGITKIEHGDLRLGKMDSAYFLSITFIATVCALSKGPHRFFEYALENPFPFSITPTQSGIIMGFLSFCYLAFRPKRMWRHPLIHLMFYCVTFVFGKHFMAGWLALNLFHNLQYLELLYKENRGLKHFALPSILTLITFQLNRMYPLTLFLISLNFTHYIWDSKVWRSRPKTL